LQRRLAAILAADVVGYSRMMSEDEAGTLAALREHRSQLLEPTIARHHGRIVKLMGDGVLAEFASVVEAVDCAAEIQCQMAARNSGASNRPTIFRIGVHLGDVIVEADDLYGDGVNIASRLEGIAEPGGICISRQAYDQVHKKLALGYRSMGPQHLKNIPEPVEAFAVQIDSAAAPDRHEIRYCRAPDGVRLAYAISGNGAPLVKTANWLNHLQYDWESPVWGDFLHQMASRHTLLRYDARGSGLSDWDVPELGLDKWVSDLETVVDAAGVRRFPLFGLSQGCAISIAYAARHPERVSHLILVGGYIVGLAKRSPEMRERRKAIQTLIRMDWGADSPALRQMLMMHLVPDASKEQIESLNELQRRTTSSECAARYFEAVGEIDVSEVAPKVAAPTLVMHARGDLQVPIEAGREMAARIPGARFVALQSNNHILLGNEPAAERFFEEMELFLAGK
jgi:class 3 adenylate cyclase/pimeloyl-ACP methyl ester carboxylesterase